MERLTAKYACIQSAYWMGLAAILSFASPYLLSQGFSNGQIGLLMAAAGILTAFLQPTAAAWADDPRRPSPWHLALLLSAGICLCAAGLLLSPGPWLVGVLYLCASAFLQTIQPLMNSLGVARQINFGLARGVGSVFFALISWALMECVALWDTRAIPAAILFCFLLFMLAAARYPLRGPETPRAVQENSASPAEFIKKYPRFCVTLLGCAFTYTSHVVVSNFLFQIVQSKGGAGMEMGTLSALSAMVELPIMFLFSRMRRRFGCDTWLRVSGIFFFLRVLATLLCPSVRGLYPVQLFQMLGWALMAVNSVYYAHSVTAPEDAVKGQAYFTLSYTVATVVGNVAGGALLDRAGAQAMLIFGVICAGIGAAVLVVTAQAGDSARDPDIP